MAFFDTRPESDAAAFQGAWSNYPFFASCSVVVNDIQRGLFVLAPDILCNTCGNGVVDPGEVCDGADLGGETCASQGCTGGGTLACLSDCSGFDTTGCFDCPTCNDNGICELGEDCNNCANDCISGTTPGASCGNGICEAGDGENCQSCPADCNGRQGGKPSNRFCCGFGGQNPVGCGDSRCATGGFQCTTAPQPPVSFCCGDGTCEGSEDSNNCAIDCGPPPCGDGFCDPATEDPCSCAVDCGTPPASEVPNVTCQDGIDNDCDGATDCSDMADCSTDPACSCLPKNASCHLNSDCCSGNCKNNNRCA